MVDLAELAEGPAGCGEVVRGGCVYLLGTAGDNFNCTHRSSRFCTYVGEGED